MIANAFNQTYTSDNHDVSNNEEFIRLSIIFFADTDGIDWDENYSCYDSDCLSSTLWKEDILDLLEDELCAQVISFTIPFINKYECVVRMRRQVFDQQFQLLASFKTGRFYTYKICEIDDQGIRISKLFKIVTEK